MTELVDPQLTAFWASDPSLLTAPEPAFVPDHHRERLALEVAAAFLIATRLARIKLGSRSNPDDPRRFAMSIWADVSPVFITLASAALRDVLTVSPVSPQLDAVGTAALATKYATGLSDYLGASSVDAFAGAVDRQAAGKWSDRAAWVRAAAGFGMDGPGYKAYLTLAGLSSEELVSPAAQTVADQHLLTRAQLVGDSESYTAHETMKALGWRTLLLDGMLPRTARRVWLTSVGEKVCPTCGPLNRKQAPLDEPFRVNGLELWSPQAHPHCRCRLVLVDALVKAYNPNERREGPGGKNPSRWAKTVEPDAAIDEMFEQARALEKEEEQTKTPSMFAPAPKFAKPRQMFAPGPMFAAPKARFAPSQARFAAKDKGLDPRGEAAFGDRRGAKAFGPRRRPQLRVIQQRMLAPPPIAPLIGEPYYMPTDRYHAEVNEHDIGSVLGMHTDVDFDVAHPTTFGTLVAEAKPLPWNVLTYQDLAAGRVETNGKGIPRTSWPEVRSWWQSFRPEAARGWDEAIRGARSPDAPDEGYVADLEPGDRKAIAELAGFTGYDDDADLTSKIMTAAEDLGQRKDDSLACAYADYVVYHRPEILGELGDDIRYHLHEAEIKHITFDDKPVDQVLTFGSGFHPGTWQDRDTVDPRGRFIVTGLTYRSAIHDYGALAPVLAVGVQEARVQPYVQHKGAFIEIPPRPTPFPPGTV